MGEVAAALAAARRVVLVPGYGLALARGHHELRRLAEALTARGVRVEYAVHPVAGRMPGHLNALLDEAQVPHAQLVEAGDVDLTDVDVALVVGADDVVNPAARTAADSPLSGLRTLEVGRARRVVVLRGSSRPGAAGVVNELFADPATTVLTGDLRETLTRLTPAVESGLRGGTGSG